MSFSHANVLGLLREGRYQSLFIEELGWDRHVASLDLIVDGQQYTLRAVAQKRGFVAFTCTPDVSGRIPTNLTRREIERRVSLSVREHLIIFHDVARDTSIWQWVGREAGKPPFLREEPYHRGLSGQRLAHVLQKITFGLDEEGDLTLTDVVRRVRSAFVEKVTKRFYEGFEKEHRAFTSALEGIDEPETQRWYTSVMLNRLMFTYFVQKKGFLDSDRNYLRTHFARSQRRGSNRYYQDFLQPLFFEGLARPRSARSPDIIRLLGEVPYLNGGLFQVHRIEAQYGGQLAIPDEAFGRSLDFFESYNWHLDDRPLHDDDEINPEVLGYIFERYTNNLQKHMGAYYTKEDITGYIARGSIIPALLDLAGEQHHALLGPQSPLWTGLQNNPNRYIQADARRGLDHDLPPNIHAAIGNPGLRHDWNTPAAEPHALPTEIWRDVIVRRQRYDQIRDLLNQGQICSVNDLITWNLDLDTVARDLILSTDDPQALLAFWTAIERVTVLDPTCGSGAFLFAALHVLQPLYELCLDRMAVIAQEYHNKLADAEALATFRAVLQRVAQHPNREYFVLKSIIVNNLYGVDVMEEAVEICKLRLFLKLAAQIEPDPTLPNLGAEPLPDIDFNVFAGNALVGYATHEEVQRAVDQTIGGQRRLQFDETIERIAAQVQQIDEEFARFRAAQMIDGGDHSGVEKRQLQRALDELDGELDRYLAGEYGIDVTSGNKFAAWRKSHTPFHWFVKFYRVLNGQGGFDVVIGNPPYVGYGKVKGFYEVRGYATESCANLYAFAVERSLALLRASGRYGMIVPIASVSTEGMRDLQALYVGYPQWHSHWAVRPGKLFVGVDMNLTISLLHKTSALDASYTTGYRRWSSGADGDRPHLFTTVCYVRNPNLAIHPNPYPKLGSNIEVQLLKRMLSFGRKLRHYTDGTGEAIYYHSGGRYWRKALPTGLSSHYKPVYVPAQMVPVTFALLNSQLFYWYWIVNSNCMDVVSREVLDLPVFPLEQADSVVFGDLMGRLLASYYASSSARVRRGERINVEEVNFDVRRAKPIIDEVDTLLASHYGFTDEELDFVLNNDIKYRVGRGGDE